MGNYEDWDPNWRPVGDPVSTDEDWNEEDSNEYDWSAEGSPAGYEPSEPSRPGRAFADLEAEYGGGTDYEFPPRPDLQAADELRDNPELAVFRRWRAQLGLPVEPEPFPDESERAEHRPEEAVVAGPALPTDWASILAATPYGAPQPYEYEPGSYPVAKPVPPAEDWEERARRTQRAFELIQAAEQADRRARVLRALETVQAAENEMPIYDEYGRVIGYTQRAQAPARNVLADANQWLVQNVPGVGGAEDVLGQVADKFRYQPTAVVAGTVQRTTEIGQKAFAELSPEDQAILNRGKRAGIAYLSTDEYQNARARYNSKIEELSAPMKKESYQEFVTKAVEHYEQNTPAWAQMALSFADPTNAVVGLPFRMATAGLNARRVGALQKAIAGLDKADDSARIVETAIRSAKAEGLGSKEASRILLNVENLVVKATHPPGIPPIAKIVPPKGTEGQDLLLEMLNKRKSPGTAPFQSLDDVAKRADEATRIVDDYRASTPGFVQFWEEPGTRPKSIDPRILLRQPLTDVDTPEVLDARLLDALTPSTWPINTLVRKQLRREAGMGLLDHAGRHYGVVPKQERQAFIITGNSGSGKSTIAIPLAQRAGARLIDPDDALLFYAEYNGINAGALHQEAIWTYEFALRKAIRNGDNIIIPRLGGDPDTVRTWRDLFTQKGYRVHLLTVDVSVETAKKSAVARFLGSEHRFVDPLIPQRVGLTPVETYEILKKEGGFATYGLYTRGGAGVRRGLPGLPRILEESAPGLGAVGGRRPSARIFPRTDRGAGPAERTAGAAIATAARARHAQTPDGERSFHAKYGSKPEPDPRALEASGALRADEPRLALQYLRQQLSKLGYSTAMMDQLRLSEAAQILAEDRGPEGQPGNASGRGSAPGDVGPSRGSRRSRPPLSLSQQMARLYRGTVAGDDYWGQTLPTDREAWAWVPDNLKRALEEYWQGTPLTRAQVQRLMPVYRRYVAKTGYPGDMVHWLTATLKNERYPF
jgi:predicted kinase